jgi:hypothetical protein
LWSSSFPLDHFEGLADFAFLVEDVSNFESQKVADAKSGVDAQDEERLIPLAVIGTSEDLLDGGDFFLVFDGDNRHSEKLLFVF